MPPEKPDQNLSRFQISPAIERWVLERWQRMNEPGISKEEWNKARIELEAAAKDNTEFQLAFMRLESPRGSSMIDALEEDLRTRQLRKAKEAVQRAEEERENKLSKNLLTNLEDTKRAMALLEGNAWLQRQKNDMGQYTITAALRWLETRKGQRGAGGDFEIYGSGGFHRYYVYPDGRVVYSGMHGRLEAERARRLGFKILE